MSDVRYVLDASALLAAMLGERGAETVEAHFTEACISSVNLSEVVAKLSERGVPEESILESLSDLDLDVRDFNTAQALRAGALRNLTRAKGLSFGDRACLALAGELGAIALTTDAAWADLELDVAVELAR
jgi:ribonuclease VapC